jgi:hypothetical protein
MKIDKLRMVEHDYFNGNMMAGETLKKIFEIFEELGSFDVDDIKFAYEVGRSHEKNNSTCTSDEIREAWLKSNQMYRHIRWDD